MYNTNDVPINNLINISEQTQAGRFYPDPTARDIPTALNTGLLLVLLVLLVPVVFLAIMMCQE